MITNYREFWDLYVREHSKPLTRVLHFVGTSLGLTLLVWFVWSGRWYYFPLFLVDEEFRTSASRDSRAVMGKSSGGYGSLIMGLRHADQFGLVCSTSGDAYFEYCYLPDLPKAFRVLKGDAKGFMDKFWEVEKKGKNDFPGVNVVGMSACYSPNGTDFDLPFDLETGELRDDVWHRWLEHDPARLVEEYSDNLKSLKLLYLDAGTRDEFALDIGARVLSRRLREHDIPHIHEGFDDGHFNISYRYDRSLELISQHLPS